MRFDPMINTAPDCATKGFKLMPGDLRDLIELRKAIAVAAGRAYDCQETSFHLRLVGLEIIVAKRIMQLKKDLEGTAASDAGESDKVD